MKKQILGTSIVSAVLLTTVFTTNVSATTTPISSNEPSVSIVSVQEIALVHPVALVKNPKPIPLESFWDRLAWCETHGNWQNGGNWAGGLGIARITWNRFGGREFAGTPDKATREEQIIIGERVAIYGWQSKNSFLTHDDRQNNRPHFRRPVGFNGWGALPCAGGTPPLLKYTEETVVEQRFKWGQKGRLVADLQAILKVKRTSTYDSATYAAHQRYLINNGKSRSLAPASPKLKRPSRVPKSATKRCPQFEKMAFDAGFPRNQIQIVSYIMWKESRCIADVTNSKDPKGGSRGLLQINGFWTKHLIKDGVIKNEKQLFDPATNLRAGFYVWTYALMKARYNYGWSPWSIW